MEVRFFKDNFNARFLWGWPDDGYTTSDSAEIEKLKGFGLRFVVLSSTENKPTEEVSPKKRGRKPKAK